MAISMKLQSVLDEAGVHYEHHVHATTYTAAETAEAIHVPGREMAKTVIVNADGQLRMAVIPATRRIDFKHLQFITRSRNIRLATEAEIRDAFPTCEVGAMPPFGNAFGLPLFCDSLLAENSSIEFNGGTHHDTVRMAFKDFKRLSNPTIADLVDHSSQAA